MICRNFPNLKDSAASLLRARPNAVVAGAKNLRFKSHADQIGHSVSNYFSSKLVTLLQLNNNLILSFKEL